METDSRNFQGSLTLLEIESQVTQRRAPDASVVQIPAESTCYCGGGQHRPTHLPEERSVGGQQ